jgi:hypothetical protein
MNFKDCWPLKGRWLRYLLAGFWFYLGITMVLVGSSLPNPPSLFLTLTGYLGSYITIRSILYGVNGR